ncbi:MAG: class I SAM-dependent methyltransferase [Candidatus Omnitrophota bacterium]
MAYFDHFAGTDISKTGRILVREKVKRQFEFLTACIDGDPGNIEVLEIGPGRGDLSKLFLERGYQNYDVVEPNIQMRQNLNKSGIREIKEYMIPHLKERDSSYDIIIAADVFEHLNDTSEAKMFIKEAGRVLKKGGILFMACPDLLDWGLDFWNGDYTHSNPTTLRRTLGLMSDNDLKICFQTYMYGCFTGIFGYLLGKGIRSLTFLSKGNSLSSKLYKLRTSFLRKFVVVGRK